MIRQIGLASVYVTDQDRVLDFYTNKLGFETISDQTLEGYRWIEVAPPGAETGLTLAPAPPGSEWEALAGTFGPLMFCDDLRATYDQYQAAGAEFVEEPTEYPWGLQAIIQDPDGNTSS